MNFPTYTRREFCSFTVQTLSLGAVTALVSGCGGSSSTSASGVGTLPTLTTISGTIVNNTIALTIDSASPLNNVGSAALVNASGRSFLVSRTGQSSFTALTAICTHEGCTVSNYQNEVYECPCHGSQYSTSGSVLKGPASSPLRQFTTNFSNNVLTITTV
jgi:cytochrome b6-f complex iron-sulfur subunit